MYQLMKPFVDYTNAQIESFTRITRSPDIAELTQSGTEGFFRAMQENQSRMLNSEVFSQLTKANVENFSRFVQDFSRSFTAFAYEAQGQLTKGVQESTKQMQQAANVTSSIVGSAVHEATESMKNATEEISEETDVTLAKARRRG